MELLFLGAGSVIPEAGRDTVTLLVNGRHIIDTGWSGARTLLDRSIDPLAVRTLLFTHFHHDHYLGLPHLLFIMGMNRSYTRSDAAEKAGGLRILGPAEHLERIVETSCTLLQWERFPELQFPLDLVPLRPGDSQDLGDVQLETISAKHGSGKGAYEPALSVRLTEKATHRALVYSGDTSYNPDLAAFSRGAHALVHDAAHSKPREAAETAVAAGVDRLFLVHYNLAGAESLLSAARELFPESYLGPDGETIDI